jgi:hypothetical protein
LASLADLFSTEKKELRRAFVKEASKAGVRLASREAFKFLDRFENRFFEMADLIGKEPAG